jgi:uncharacterized protein YbaP (TraB family)
VVKTNAKRVKLMKVIKLLISILWMTGVLLHAEGAPKPFLWQAQKEEHTLYLFGTIHLSDPSFSPLPMSVQNAIEDSDAVFTEIPMDMESQMRAAALMLRKDTKSLKEVLSQRLFDQTRRYLQSIHPSLTLQPMERMKVWAIYATVQMLENQLIYPTFPAMDTLIYQEAKQRGKVVGGIESVEEQIGAMDRFSLEEQKRLLQAVLDYLAAHKDAVSELKRIYKGGEGKEMLRFIYESMPKVEEYKALEQKFFDVLLYDRNRLMFERLIKRVEKHAATRHFFAFGVMHFLGERSILEMLEQRGYTIRRFNHPDP